MFRWLPVVLLLCACNRHKEVSAASPAVQESELQITQFYAEPVVPRGEKTNVCYGTDGARNVRLDPPIEKVWPTIARCFPVDPAKNPVLTLTADDGRGGSVSRKLAIRVGPPRARIIEVSINKTEAQPGENIVLCYKAENATSVDAGPGNWVTTRSNDHACLVHHPTQTTTYHVNITGANGSSDSEHVTVRVR